jgi:hypothetical protein
MMPEAIRIVGDSGRLIAALEGAKLLATARGIVRDTDGLKANRN